MANKNNLINPKDRTSSELREMTRKGGIKSGEARRRKKTMREALEILLFNTKLNEQTKQMLKAEGVENADDFNHQMVITRSLIAKAEAGDVQAYNTICAMIGEKPAEKMDLNGLPQTLEIIYRGKPEDAQFPSDENQLDLERNKDGKGSQG
jgi:hypothetical protein